MRIEQLIDRLATLQSAGEDGIPEGNFKSTRYHALFKFKRDEDNVYFVSWILQLLKRNIEGIPENRLLTIQQIIFKGEKVIELYRNRYGDKTYNFYRPKAWFPNGRFLHRFKKYQPTDDSDDTSIAMRGKDHDKAYAQEIKDIYIHQSNGLRGRWIKRCPEKYRTLKTYNTWIGSEGLFVDFDFVVMCNILMFNAQYDLGICEQDEESIRYIKMVCQSTDLSKESWAVSCWYPSSQVMRYSLADVIATGYYRELEPLREYVIQQSVESIRVGIDGIGRIFKDHLPLEYLLDAISILKLDPSHDIDHSGFQLDGLLKDYQQFTFGVIPLTHPWDGLLSQKLGANKLFRMHYECEAQVVAILLEYQLLVSASS